MKVANVNNVNNVNTDIINVINVTFLMSKTSVLNDVLHTSGSD